MNIKTNTKYLIAISHFSKFGPVRLKKINRGFRDYKTAFDASSGELVRAGIEENIAHEFIAFRQTIEVEKLIEKILKENIKILCVDDPNYPKLLKEIYTPPHLLYYKGEIKDHSFNLAVVGTRKYSPYGEQATIQITKGLAQNKITIISGLALGIDTIAHQTAISSGGQTIAVLGTGVDTQSTYPASNRYLIEKIIKSGGAVISEFPPGTPPLRHHFPQRNRIISGLSLGTLVIEAGERSGALITARQALDQNREVFAVPGNIFSPVSKGPNQLIKQGARAITSYQDIMETLDLNEISILIKNKEILPKTKEEKVIIEHLKHEPTHINELIRLCGLSAAKVSSTLIIMEMKGMIKNVGNMEYVLTC
jgi:DNA processing protein